MRVLLLTNYFHPDLSAGSFRMQALVEVLSQNDEVVVVCMAPNRYDAHTPQALQLERDGSVTIHRVPVGAHGGSMLAQARNFMRFMLGAATIARTVECDVVFATSSRLFTAVLGAWLARSKRRPYVLDIRDIFVDTIKDVMQGFWIRTLLPLLSLLERFAIGTADRVVLVSPGFVSYFQPRYRGKRFELVTNGVDPVFVEDWCRLAPPKKSRAGARLRILYAGNIGEGQGLERILPSAAKACERIADFVLFGDGGRREALERELKRLGVGNVEIHAPLPRRELVREYASADALLLHLNDYAAFHKVLPSKLFEYGATGLPMLAGTSGVAAQFIRDELPDALLFRPCDDHGLIAAIESLRNRRSLKGQERAQFVTRYSRSELSARLAQIIHEAAALPAGQTGCGAERHWRRRPRAMRGSKQ